MKGDGILTLEMLKQARQRAIAAFQKEYKENEFIIFNGKCIKWDGNENKFIAENMKKEVKNDIK